MSENLKTARRKLTKEERIKESEKITITGVKNSKRNNANSFSSDNSSNFNIGCCNNRCSV